MTGWAVGMALVGGVISARAVDAPQPAVVSHLLLLSDKSEDISSPEAWKKTYIKEGMSEQDKAIAIWKTVVKYRHQDNPPGEGLEGNPDQKSNVHEPFKTFHVYGYGMCCCAAADIEGLARYIGMPARGRLINLHSVPEVWYDNAWHLLDASLMFYLRKPADGKIASVDEMKKDIMDWRKGHPEVKNDNDLKKFARDEGWKKGPPLFATCQFYDKDGINRAGWHGWWSNMAEYNYKHPDEKSKMIVVPPDTNPAWNIFDYGAIMGYQLNVQLREGEKLTRCWYANQAATGLNRKNTKRYDKFLKGDRSALGLQQELGDLAPGRVGNGTLQYDALADSKLSSNALTVDNLILGDGKIRVKDGSKPGVLVIRMPCSYLYLNGEMKSKPIVGAGGSIATFISFNNGLDWKELAKFDKSGDQQINLKDGVFNKYDYRVKFEFNGSGTGLDALKFVHDIQHSQAPLPLIAEGDNKITFNAGAQEGTITVQGNMNSDTTGGKTMSIADFHPTVEGCNVKMFLLAGGHATAIIPVTTPGDITRVRLGVHWRARDPKDSFDVQTSFDNGASWKSIGQLDQANPAKSTYIISSDVPTGKKTVQIKFAGTQKNTTCIFDLRVDVDYQEPAGGFRPVLITYVWDEGGQPKTAMHVVKASSETYTIKCGPKTTVKSVSMELAK